MLPVHAVVLNNMRTTGRRSRDPSKTDDSVFKPMKFDQRLLICNAYPSSSRMTIRKNEKDTVADSKHGIGYRECRYMDAQVRPKDKLELTLADLGVSGSFEVGDLPTSDAVLLLVLEKRPGSALVSFKSFAFPSGGHKGSEAQLAVIDAFHGNSSSPRLKMEDHVVESKGQKDALSRRIEELPFNRVYAVEEGTYDASLLDQASKKDARHILKLARGQNYVLLRTGDDMLGEAQSLVVFPNAEFRSLASPLARTSLATWAAALAALIVSVRLA